MSSLELIEVGVLFVSVVLHSVNMLGGLSYAFNPEVCEKMGRWLGFTFAYYISINNMLPVLSRLLNVMFGINTTKRWVQSVSLVLFLVVESLIIKHLFGK